MILRCKNMVLRILPALIFINFSSCGPNTSANKIFNTKANSTRFDVILGKAQLLHDQGDYQGSLEELNKIIDFQDHSEASLQLKAFNELGLAGFDLFDLSIKLSEESKSLSQASDNSSFQTIIQNLSSILDIDDTTLEKYGHKSEFNSNDILKDLPLYIPRAPGSHLQASDPRASISMLENLNKAITTICPLIAEDLRKIEGELTMPRYQCEPFKGRIKSASQAYFVFFLAHFAEALFFNIALLYSPEASSLHLKPETLFLKEVTTEDQSALFQRIIAVEKAAKKTITTLDQLGDLTEALAEVASNVQSVFDTNPGAPLYEMMNDLEKAGDTIGYIAGMPASFGEQITKAISNINSVASKAGTKIDSLGNQTTALKDQLGFKIITKLDTQVSAYFDKLEQVKQTNGGDLSTCQKAKVAKMCSAVDKVFNDLAGVSTPQACKEYQDEDTGNTDPDSCS